MLNGRKVYKLKAKLITNIKTSDHNNNNQKLPQAADKAVRREHHTSLYDGLVISAKCDTVTNIVIMNDKTKRNKM